MTTEYLNSVRVTTNGDGVASTGVLATEGKQDTAITAMQNADYVVARRYTGTIGASAVITGAPLSAVLTGAVRLIIIPRGAVYMNFGAAADDTKTLVPLGGLNMPVTAALAATIYLFAASIKCDLLVCIPRN